MDTTASSLQAIANTRFGHHTENRSDTSIENIGDTAMATERIEIEVVSGDRHVDLDSRNSTIWVKRDVEGQEPWQFVCWQSTPIA